MTRQGTQVPVGGQPGAAAGDLARRDGRPPPVWTLGQKRGDAGLAFLRLQRAGAIHQLTAGFDHFGRVGQQARL